MNFLDFQIQNFNSGVVRGFALALAKRTADRHNPVSEKFACKISNVLFALSFKAVHSIRAEVASKLEAAFEDDSKDEGRVWFVGRFAVPLPSRNNSRRP